MRRLVLAVFLVAGAFWAGGASPAEAAGTRTIWNGPYRWQYSNNRAYAKPRLVPGNTFVQLGPVPALGGIRSLPGWSGAR